jgi:two-component system sensor histidine kinase KdpD
MAVFVPSAFRSQWRGILIALLLVGLMTAILIKPVQTAELRHITTIYLVPVLFAATRWGIGAAIAAAIAGVAAAAFFFYPPLFDWHVADPGQLLDLVIFICVAIVTGQLATNLRKQAEIARRREDDMRDLYAFSRRLATAFAADAIYAAIQDHLTSALQREVILFESTPAAGAALNYKPGVPACVIARVEQAAAGRNAAASATVIDDGGSTWLVRAVSPQMREFGVIAINLGPPSQDSIEALRTRVDNVLADATATLERLDVARALAEARMHAETEGLRDALIGSVSHELRTPLSSILGAATVLITAPSVTAESRFAALVRVIREEAERLNDDIQKLLDATRISSRGVRPREEWADPADIVNAAVEHCRRRIGNHKLNIEMAADLPLIYVDAVLIEQALVQVLDNALKYSSDHSSIDIAIRARDGDVVFSVSDRGRGLTSDEIEHMWERFYRGPRHVGSIGGSGLGLWIAQSFVVASGGRLEAASEGEDRGTCISIELPLAKVTSPQLESVDD